jgi:GNAT superfamily N-acetyltransferase
LLDATGVADRVAIVEGASDLVGDFAALTDVVYAATPSLRDHPGRPTSGRIAGLLDEAHPQRRRASLRLFLSPGRSRVAAIVNPRLVDDAGAPIGLLGFFESLDDEDAARAVLGAGVAWLRAQGATIVRGPINYSTWNDYRFTVGPSTSPGWFQGEPLHPESYPRLWGLAGFAVATRYGSYWLGDLEKVRARFAGKIANARNAGVVVRPVGAADLPSLYRLALDGFRGAYMYSPIDPEEFATLYSADRAADVAGTSFIAIHDGRAVGFVYTYVAELPDGPAGVVKTIVVAPEARAFGVYHDLLATSLEAFLERGVTRALGGLMHAEGDPSLMGWCRPEMMFKQYALHELTA